MPRNENFSGALFMTLAMLGFAFNDAMVKMAAPHLNTGQIMFIRGLITAILIIAVAWKLGALRPLRTLLDPYLALRTFAELLASVTYVGALAILPLPNAAAILQALPLAVTMGAALFFHEPVGWRRWTAIAIGLAGVLVIIRPGTEGFTAGSLLVVGSVISSTIRDLSTRKIDPATPTLFVSAVTSVAVTIFGAALIQPMGGWHAVSATDLIALTLGAAALFLGYQSLIKSMRLGEISFIAPFRYTGLLWSVLIAAILLAEYPDRWILIGSAIVVGAGIYTFYRESRRHRALLTAAAEASPP